MLLLRTASCLLSGVMERGGWAEATSCLLCYGLGWWPRSCLEVRGKARQWGDARGEEVHLLRHHSTAVFSVLQAMACEWV